MDKSGTGGIQQQLKTGGSTSATLASGGNAVFQFNDLLDRAPTGMLALYLTALFLTFAFTLTQAGGTGVAIPRDRLPGLLVDSVDWTQSWMGAVAPKAVFAGSRLPIVEYVAGGFQYAQRQQNPIPAANGAYPYSMSVRVPALNDRRGRIVKETSNLALLFQPSQLKVTMAALATLTAFSPGATLSTFVVSLTAQLEPRQELVLGTPMEWVLHTPVAGGSQVTIFGFGRDTAMTGVRPKGGVAFCADLSDASGQGGCVRTNLLTDFQFQWRGQPVTTAMKEYVQQYLDLLPNSQPNVSGNVSFATATEINDFGAFPYSQDNAGGSSAGSLTTDLNALLGWFLALGGDHMSLTDLETAENDQTFNLSQTGGFAAIGANHLILAQYARVWEYEKRADWISQITRGGDSSLAAYVLGGSNKVSAALAAVRAKGDLFSRRPNDKHVVTPDQETYLGWQFINP